MIVRNKAIVFWLIIIPTIVAFYASLVLTILWRYPEGLQTDVLVDHFQAFTVVFAFWIVVFFSHNLYEPETFRRYTTLFFTLLSAMVLNVIVAAVFFYFQPDLILTPRRFLLSVGLISFVLILFWNLLLKYFLQNRFLKFVYLFSFDKELEKLEHEIRSRNYLGYRVLGHLNELQLSDFKPPRSSIVILPDHLHTNQEVVVKFYQLRNQGVTFYNHKDFYQQLLRRVYLPGVDQLWLLENINYTSNPVYEMMKVLMDKVFGFVMFLFFIVVYPFVALTHLPFNTKMFFTQERIGKNGKSFKIYKFRTMSNGPTDTWTTEGDVRITRMGKWMRRTRIDELPQFVNLLKGNMSLVGPRPEQNSFLNYLKTEIPFFEERHMVKPGITGWAQLNVYAGSVEETKLKLEYDLYYIKHRSLLLDLEIVIKTAYNILMLKGK